ncbi:MAG TPA: thioredoxin [Spirochaetota bacterium]|jgi:thioredoxin 1|nr:thioredoxin [Spirochaetota bacterium]OPZ38792.1 MAG: Thioredoxin-1 [Spirochaetes bacterium ADurb.BinA120]HNU91967.1 thioredoxin [Spirochaetota bacterium]HPI15045.1 thioredoxin [Spirochaetota bacterium]HPV98517.1 thioredoxin [Spirochaetota bacterium]
MAGILEVNDGNFNKEVLEASGKVLVDFWAPWCGPCRMQTPILERLAQSGAISAKITKLNTDENPQIAQKYGISSIPTLILFADGNETERMIGVQPESVLSQKLS